MLKSLGVHLLALLLLMLIPAQAMRSTAAPTGARSGLPSSTAADRGPRARESCLRGRERRRPSGRGATAAASRRPRQCRTERPSVSESPGTPNLPPGAEAAAVAEVQPQRKVGEVGILAFRDKFASLSQDKVVPRLGADARYSAADDTGKPSSRSALTTTAPGSSGGINNASLSRSVGAVAEGAAARATAATVGAVVTVAAAEAAPGVQVGRATSSIAAIGGGDDRPKARNGMGPSRTDEEIQIVFDRYKASFYRLYNRELRNSPTLQGQMVLRLTIEPDGSVSMCALQSSDMNAPDLAAQVVERVKGINFGAKEGVQAVTIVVPDRLPAGVVSRLWAGALAPACSRVTTRSAGAKAPAHEQESALM